MVPNQLSKAIPAYPLYYRILGRLLAKFFINDGYFTSVPLCIHVLKLMKNEPIVLDDLLEVDSEIHRGLQWILENPIGDSLELSFTAEFLLFSEHHQC